MMSFDGFPYQKHTPFLKEYILVSTGYHLAGFLVHFYKTRKNDYIEMGLHHIVALFLCVGAYLSNIWETAILVAFVHDMAEVVVKTCKSLAETHFRNLTFSMFLYLNAIWLYTRIFCYSQFVY